MMAGSLPSSKTTIFFAGSAEVTAGSLPSSKSIISRSNARCFCLSVFLSSAVSAYSMSFSTAFCGQRTHVSVYTGCQQSIARGSGTQQAYSRGRTILAKSLSVVTQRLSMSNRSRRSRADVELAKVLADEGTDESELPEGEARRRALVSVLVMTRFLLSRASSSTSADVFSRSLLRPPAPPSAFCMAAGSWSRKTLFYPPMTDGPKWTHT